MAMKPSRSNVMLLSVVWVAVWYQSMRTALKKYGVLVAIHEDFHIFLIEKGKCTFL